MGRRTQAHAIDSRRRQSPSRVQKGAARWQACTAPMDREPLPKAHGRPDPVPVHGHASTGRLRPIEPPSLRTARPKRSRPPEWKSAPRTTSACRSRERATNTPPFEWRRTGRDESWRIDDFKVTLRQVEDAPGSKLREVDAVGEDDLPPLPSAGPNVAT